MSITVLNSYASRKQLYTIFFTCTRATWARWACRAGNYIVSVHNACALYASRIHCQHLLCAFNIRPYRAGGNSVSACQKHIEMLKLPALACHGDLCYYPPFCMNPPTAATYHMPYIKYFVLELQLS